MRYKRLIAYVLCMVIAALGAFPVYAEKVSEVTAAYMLEGEVYYCNSNTGEIVLKNVKPIAESEEAEEMAKALEYTETRLFDKTIYLGDGTQIGYDWINNYADDKVRVIGIRQDNGNISIIYLKFV